MATPALRNAVATASAAGASYAVTAPTMADGDMLVIGLMFPSGMPTITPPAGFTAQAPHAFTAGVATFTKPISSAAGEPATYAFTFGASATCIGIAASVSGAKTNYVDSTFNQAFSATASYATVTGVAANPLVLSFTSWLSAGEDPPTVSSGWSAAVSGHGTTGTAAFSSKGATQASGVVTPSGSITGAGGGTNVITAQVVLYDATSNIRPTVMTPKGVETLAGAAATVTATASDPDGTISSYLWELMSDNASAFTLANTTTATVTVTPAAASVVDTAGLRCTVTDNGGATNQAFSAVTNLPAATSWASGL